MDGFINVDLRSTGATDFAMDCTDLSIFPSGSISLVFANAFLEHLWAEDQARCLMEVYRVLKDGGRAIFLGIPDFERIAQGYVSREPGLTSEIFSLYDAFRLTHGDPAKSPIGWTAQLHRALFDKRSVSALLKEAGFSCYVVFRYAYRQDKIDPNLGFIAIKGGLLLDRDWTCRIVSEVSSDVRLDSVNLLGGIDVVCRREES